MTQRWIDRLIVFAATGCGSGLVPKAPGTAGSLVGLFLALGLFGLGEMAAAVLIAVFLPAAVVIADKAEKHLQKTDPGCIVIDEIAGMLITLFGIPLSAGTAVGGFILFRIFDITKPFPIRYLERRIPGGAGIVADDLAAGIYANLLLRIALALWGAGVG